MSNEICCICGHPCTERGKRWSLGNDGFYRHYRCEGEEAALSRGIAQGRAEREREIVAWLRLIAAPGATWDAKTVGDKRTILAAADALEKGAGRKT